MAAQSTIKDSTEANQNSTHTGANILDSPPLAKETADSINQSNQAFYDSLRAQSKDTWTELLVNAVIVPSHKRIDGADFIESTSPFGRFRGKAIEEINIKQVDTFTGNVDDTSTVIASSSLFSILNSLHYESREWVIAKNLMFEIGDTLTAFTLSDNERVLRVLPYIEDARIYVDISKVDTNNVAVTVVTRDVYSLGFSAIVNSLEDGRLKIFDRNFFGLGSTLQGTYLYHGSKNPKNGLELEYKADNIGGYFISGLLRYRNTADEEGARLEFNKAFLTPETHYGGGLILEQLHTDVGLVKEDTNLIVPITRNFEDIWIGRQFLVTEQFNRRNLVFAGRFMRREYTLRPEVSSDANEPFHTVLMALGSIMFTRARYFQSNMILGFGQTEDIPVGYRIKFTAGPRWSEFSSRLYSGILFTGAGIFKPLGYFLGTIEFGNLYNGRRLEERIIKTHLMQFSPLLSIGKYRIRTFIRSNYIIGLELWNELNVRFNPNSGIRGLPNLNLSGKQRFNLAVDMIAFAPWNLYGFKFALYGFADIGFLGPSQSSIKPEHFYSGIGCGFRIRNESLVFKTLQFRFAYYPKVPAGSSHYAYQLSTRDPQIFENFAGAKPQIINFR